MSALISKLPEPYRSQAIAARAEQYGPKYDIDALRSAFHWCESPQGWNYWNDVNEGRFPAAPAPEDLRIADLERRVGVLEGLVIPPAAPVCDVVAPSFAEDEYPTTPPDPGSGYRLLEKGDPIIRGRAEAWHPEEGVWDLGPVRGWDGDTFDPDTDYWFREPATVEPGEGYRLVVEGERIEAGDEEADNEGGGGWSVVSYSAEGDTFRSRSWFPVRRKLKPTYYRLLNPGEVILEGDEVWINSCECWEEYSPVAIGEPKADYPAPPARRPLAYFED